MKDRDRSLLGQIERGALDEKTSITSLLHKCIVLGGRAGSIELRDWARRELRGYEASDQLPDYRKVGAAIGVDAVSGNYMVKNQTISPFDLPDFVQDAGIGEVFEVRMGIGRVEDLARTSDDSVKLSLPDGASLAKLMNTENGNPYQAIHRVFWMVSPVAFQGVVDQVRTSLVELVAELVAHMPDGQREPTREAADLAAQFIVTGKRHTLNIVNAQASAGGANTVSLPSTAERESFWQRWRKRGVVIGIATVVAGAVAIFTWLEWTPWR